MEAKRRHFAAQLKQTKSMIKVQAQLEPEGADSRVFEDVDVSDVESNASSDADAPSALYTRALMNINGSSAAKFVPPA